jgi:flagellar protein FlgJ
MNGLPAAYTTATTALQAGQKPNLPAGMNPEEAKKAAQEFEAMFLTQMLETMFKDVPTGGAFGGGPAEDIYRSFMLKEYGTAIAKAGGIGLADTVMHEMIKLQEAVQ